MSRVTLDPSGQFMVTGITDRVEVCDASGRRSGIFTPDPDRSLYEGVEVPVGIEELRRPEQEGGDRSLAEILADRSHLS
jgi:hypothetical protein